jgi:hypothetical protein
MAHWPYNTAMTLERPEAVLPADLHRDRLEKAGRSEPYFG